MESNKQLLGSSFTCSRQNDKNPRKIRILKIKFPWPRQTAFSIKQRTGTSATEGEDVPSSNPSGSAQRVSGRLWGPRTSPGALLLHYGSLQGSVSAGKGRQSNMVNNMHNGWHSLSYITFMQSLETRNSIWFGSKTLNCTVSTENTTSFLLILTQIF